MNTPNRVSVYTRRITPECVNMGRGITTSGIILILISIALVIMLIISTVFVYYKSNKSTTKTAGSNTKSDEETDDEKKLKTSGVLQIICTVLGVCTLLVGIWHYIVGTNLVKCINDSPSSS